MMDQTPIYDIKPYLPYVDAHPEASGGFAHKKQTYHLEVHIPDEGMKKIPEEKRHLLYENYHPLFVYRQKMSKQADAILGMLLHSNFFTEEELKRNYDFYQTVTLHHSSLST